jgi:hypothetical protein
VTRERVVLSLLRFRAPTRSLNVLVLSLNRFFVKILKPTNCTGSFYINDYDMFLFSIQVLPHPNVHYNLLLFSIKILVVGHHTLSKNDTTNILVGRSVVFLNQFG